MSSSTNTPNVSDIFTYKRYLTDTFKEKNLDNYKYHEKIYAQRVNQNSSVSEETKEFLAKNIQLAINYKNVEVLEFMLTQSVFSENYRQLFHENNKILNFLNLMMTLSVSADKEDIQDLPQKTEKAFSIIDVLVENSLIPDMVSCKYVIGAFKSFIPKDRDKLYEIIMPFFDKQKPPGILSCLQECAQGQEVIGFKRALEAMEFSVVSSQEIKNLLYPEEESIANFYSLEDYLLALAQKEKRQLESQVATKASTEPHKTFKL